MRSRPNVAHPPQAADAFGAVASEDDVRAGAGLCGKLRRTAKLLSSELLREPSDGAAAATLEAYTQRLGGHGGCLEAAYIICIEAATPATAAVVTRRTHRGSGGTVSAATRQLLGSF
jgi:hypothetical protein